MSQLERQRAEGEFEPGIYDGLPEDQYHNGPGVSNSMLTILATKSPAHLKVSIESPEDNATPAMLLGRALHCLVLEPEIFEMCYVKGIKVDKRTKAGKAQFDNFLSSVGDRTSIDPSDWDTIHRISDSVHKHPIASALLDSGISERSLYWRDKETGLLCRSRVDHWSDAHLIPCDVKTTLDAGYSQFAKSVNNFRYHCQDAMYVQGLNALGLQCKRMCFIAVEKTPPYAIGCYFLDDAARELGTMLVRHALREYAQCLSSDTWPAYPPEIRTLTLPPFAFRQDIR